MPPTCQACGGIRTLHRCSGCQVLPRGGGGVWVEMGALPLRGMGAAKRATSRFFPKEKPLCLVRFFRKGAVVVFWSFLVRCYVHCI